MGSGSTSPCRGGELLPGGGRKVRRSYRYREASSGAACASIDIGIEGFLSPPSAFSRAYIQTSRDSTRPRHFDTLPLSSPHTQRCGILTDHFIYQDAWCAREKRYRTGGKRQTNNNRQPCISAHLFCLPLLTGRRIPNLL